MENEQLIEGEDPNVEAGKPNVEAREPNIEVGNPNIEVGNTNVEGENTNVEAGNPNVEVGKPNVEVEEPKPTPVKSKKLLEIKLQTLANTPKKVPLPEKRNRKGITAMFSIEESEHLSVIIKNRVEAGITANESHFVRQCIDFAINKQFFKEKDIDVEFGTHDSTQPWEYKLLKDALFANKTNQLPVCK